MDPGLRRDDGGIWLNLAPFVTDPFFVRLVAVLKPAPFGA